MPLLAIKLDALMLHAHLLYLTRCSTLPPTLAIKSIAQSGDLGNGFNVASRQLWLYCLIFFSDRDEVLVSFNDPFLVLQDIPQNDDRRETFFSNLVPPTSYYSTFERMQASQLLR